MADLCGPKIRVGTIQNNAMLLEPGDILTIQRQAIVGENLRISTNYPALIDDLEIGQRVLIDDGAIRMIVTDKSPGSDELHCQITTGGILQSNKGFNLPHTKINLPSITEKDWKDVDFALQHDLDYIALSFVRSAEDILQLRKYLDSKGSKIHIISKIEMPQAIHNLPAIIDASNVVLVAPRRFGVEMDPHLRLLPQKDIVNACHEAGKPVIVATGTDAPEQPWSIAPRPPAPKSPTSPTPSSTALTPSCSPAKPPSENTPSAPSTSFMKSPCT